MENQLDACDDVVAKAEKDFDFLRFTIVDFHGVGKTRTVPRENFRQVFENGFYCFSGVLSKAINGDFEGITMPNSELSNFKCLPIPETLHALPLKSTKYRVGEAFCRMVKADGSPHKEVPRGIALSQLEELNQLGYQLKSAWEVEYMVLDGNTKEPKFQGSGFMGTGLGIDHFGEVCYEAQDALQEIGISIEGFLSENGNSQLEFVMAPSAGIKSADDLIMLKDVLRDVHHNHGDQAVFMSKPFPGNFSNGIHFNHSLIGAESQNAFSDLSNPNKLSDAWEHWLAGLVKHSKALTALTCPTVNCYRRLHHFLVPSKADWGIDDRRVTFRVKNYTTAATFIENRLPSGSCNPYLVMAATVAAGIDGLKNKFRLPGDSKMSSDLPKTLQEALTALNEDKYLVESLGPNFICWFTQAKNIELKLLETIDLLKDDESMYKKERNLYMDVV